ncbi:universal stress protein [Maribacter sp. CXY002]|uniref:universal stress protein n=1 Tax=Maribacter luteocoastalis TaxID=3407671 RepID=UPI003B6732A2
MKSIIVPIDFSETCEHAFEVAAAIAKEKKATLYALHMLELNQAMLTSSEGFHPEQTVFLIKLAEKRLNEFLYKPYLEGVNVVPIIKHFKVFSEISHVAKEHNADLIVMGSHGTEGLKEMFIGSNTEKVVRNSDTPVLVIKSKLKGFNPKQMVFACDLKEEYVQALQKAQHIADAFSIHLKLVYVNTPGDDFLSTFEINERIKSFSKYVGADLEIAVYNDYNIERGVLNYGREINADLIGVPTHGRKGLSHFFMGSIGEDIANHSTLPVVTFKL